MGNLSRCLGVKYLQAQILLIRAGKNTILYQQFFNLWG